VGKGLGAGLGALFGAAGLEEAEAEFEYLAISRVEPRDGQPRGFFDEESLEELADSIRIHGVIQPITVRKLDDGFYQIVAGERRWRAARIAGLVTIPARVIDADDRGVAELAMIENLQREDLNPIEEARGYKKLIDEFGMTQEEVADRVGKSRPAVANAVRLLALGDAIIEHIERGELSAGAARAVLGLEEGSRLEAAEKIISAGMTAREAENYVKRLKAGPKKRQGPGAIDDYVKAVESRLTSAMQRKVKIIYGRKKGRFEIEYYGSEDFERLSGALENLALKEEKK
jgi:ParB family chromosome partitioning protein